MQDAATAWMDEVHRSGQSHLLRFWDELSDEQRHQLAEQIRSIDFALMEALAKESHAQIDWKSLANRSQPPEAIRLQGSSEHSLEDAIACGEAAIRAGKVAMILVAGGQGTRLGFDLPKGMFPIGPVSKRSLFAMHVDSLRATMQRYGVSIPLLVMTSPATDAQTREYFAANGRFGLREEELQIFCQGTMPAVDATSSKILLDSPSSIALSPDGHGGIVQAMQNNGILKSAEARGIEYFFYAQVDNPLVRACDPSLIGYHILTQSEMTTQVVPKRFGKEKVGNVVSIDNRTHIIEYSDLPDEAAERRHVDGGLLFWAGNIAIHVMNRSFLQAASNDASALPFHRAHKAVPHVDDAGERIQPTAPNGIKFERFVFDLLPLAKRAIVVEGEPSKVFAPVKNADGAPTDTPSTAQAALVALHRSWLEAAGLNVAPGVKVEINPCWALDEAEVRSKIHQVSNILVDTYFA